MSDYAIRCRGLGLELGGQTIYESLDFEVRDGEFLCILGPSGCGKSTSLRVIGDLLEVDAGTMEVLGQLPRDAWPHLAYVFQSPRLVPWRNATGNVVLGMQLRHDKMARRDMEARARELLDLVGLGADVEKYPRALSGGEGVGVLEGIAQSRQTPDTSCGDSCVDSGSAPDPCPGHQEWRMAQTAREFMGERATGGTSPAPGWR